MGRTARREIIDESEVGIYHCFSRCVRRAFLMGEDRLTGKSYEHRRDWIDEEARRLAGFFAIDVLGYGWMTNHFHNIVRNRPDLVLRMSDREVARRWLEMSATQSQRHVNRSRRRFNERCRALVRDRERMKEIRARLSSISWFQRKLKETIARRANAEEGITGRFWDGRFHSLPICTESDLLAAMIYVDLNPIRAGLADTPETSRYTSAFARIQAESLRRASAGVSEQDNTAENVASNVMSIDTLAESNTAAVHRMFDDWLSPIQIVENPGTPQIVTVAVPEMAVDEVPVVVADVVKDAEFDASTANDAIEQTASSAAPSTASDVPRESRTDFSDLLVPLPPRASDRGCFAMTLDQYLEMLDWSGRQLRLDQRQAIPSHLPPILERLGFAHVESWMETLCGYVKRIARFFRAPVNTPEEVVRSANGEHTIELSAAVI